MRLFGRRDSSLIIGLTVALTVVFARQISSLLDAARDVEQAHGLSLIPGLIILTVVFVLHQQGKRQEMKAEAVASAAAAQESEARAKDLELLIAFGQGLARALDLDSIRDVLLQHMPHLASTPDVWVLLQVEGGWQSLIAPSARGDVGETEAARERAAQQALEPGGVQDPDAGASFPMVAGGAPVGVVGVPKATTLTASQHRIMAAASALLAVSVKNAQLFRETKENSLRDGLTGCVNRTPGLEMAEIELRRARRTKQPISLIMFDLDHFKAINDRFGHLCGDAALVAVGKQMSTVLRASDLKCRYGGEEFLVVLPETPIDGGRRVAEILRKEIGDTPLVWEGELVVLNASFGVTCAMPDEVDALVLIARADAALYCAKSAGRNCVRVGDPVLV